MTWELKIPVNSVVRVVINKRAQTQILSQKKAAFLIKNNYIEAIESSLSICSAAASWHAHADYLL